MNLMIEGDQWEAVGHYRSLYDLEGRVKERIDRNKQKMRVR